MSDNTQLTHLKRRGDMGKWAECGWSVKGLEEAGLIVKSNPTCPECRNQAAFNVERNTRRNPNRWRGVR